VVHDCPKWTAGTLDREQWNGILSGLCPRADFSEAVVDPHLRQLFLGSVLGEAGAEAAEVNVV